MVIADTQGARQVLFMPEPTHYKLTFEDPKYAGLEVVAEAVSTGEFLELTELAASAKPVPGAEPAADVKQSTVRLLRAFGAALVEWNIGDKHGQPVPATYEGLLTQKFDFNMELITAWFGAIADVDPTLPGGSASGGPALEESLQLASSSKSRPS